MGIFAKNILVGGDKNGRFETVSALVDTGAIYSMFPAKLLKSLGVEPFAEREFTLADGSKRRLELGEVRLRIGPDERPSIAIFGPDDRALLGAVSLQEFGLIADTTHHELIPAPELPL